MSQVYELCVSKQECRCERTCTVLFHKEFVQEPKRIPVKGVTLHWYYSKSLEAAREWTEDSDRNSIGLDPCAAIHSGDDHQYTVAVEAEAEILVMELTELRRRD